MHHWWTLPGRSLLDVVGVSVHPQLVALTYQARWYAHGHDLTGCHVDAGGLPAG